MTEIKREAGPLTEPIKVLVPCGPLGSGVRESEVAYGIAKGAHVIASDAGSTDSGAAYLALGKSKYNRGAVRRDLQILLKAHAEHGIPVIIGTSGQAGGDINLDWTRDIVLELVAELGISPKIALIRCEQDKDTVRRLNREGRIHALAPLGPLDDQTIDRCDHIVAALGVEPFLAALDGGADINLAGRSTDTAVLACYPIWKGAPWGAAWHAGKTGECGVQCSVNPTRGSGILLSVGADGFEVAPLSDDNACSTHSVSAHMLYENTDPFRLLEPGGTLDVTEARYRQLDDRTVAVTGSQWEPGPYSMKLEGAGGGQFQTMMLVGVRDPEVLGDIDNFHDKLLAALYDPTRASLPAEELGEFHISLRMYGWNAIDGLRVPEGTPPPREIGMVFIATADTQDLATAIANACNPYFFHFPNVLNKEIPSYGFMLSPADVACGQIYEFYLTHIVSRKIRSRLCASTIWGSNPDATCRARRWSMVKLRDVCHEIRSKNAGPFWVTFDIFFDGPENFRRYQGRRCAVGRGLCATHGADASCVKRIPVEYLSMVKISYPRTSPQGGMVERDMHSGQQYVPLLDVELAA